MLSQRSRFQTRGCNIPMPHYDVLVLRRSSAPTSRSRTHALSMYPLCVRRCICVYLSTPTCTYERVFVHVHACVRTHQYMYVRVPAHVYGLVCVHMSVYGHDKCCIKTYKRTRLSCAGPHLPHSFPPYRRGQPFYYTYNMKILYL